MPWGAAASVAGSVISGALGSSSADDAAKASAKATAASNAMLQKQQDTNTANFAPYTNTGGLANQRLAQYLGLNIYDQGSGFGSGQSSYGLGDLINVDNQGNFTENQQLAAISPEYRKAFQDWTNWHQKTYGTSANLSKNSNEGSAESGLATFLPGGLDALNREASNYNSQRSDAFTGDPSYGSLLKNFGQNDLNNDVVYNTGLQFGLDQGTSAINRLSAANGGIDSGATLKALTRYANDYGTTKASGAFDRFNTNKLNNYNMLSGQSGQGLSATNNLANINSNLLTGQTNNTLNNGQMQGQYGIMGAQSINNAVQGGIGNLLYNNRTSTPSNSSIVGASQLGGGPGINLSGYTSSIPWYA